MVAAVHHIALAADHHIVPVVAAVVLWLLPTAQEILTMQFRLEAVDHHTMVQRHITHLPPDTTVMAVEQVSRVEPVIREHIIIINNMHNQLPSFKNIFT